MACGCVVFTSFNHALADLLTPGQTAHQIGQGSLANDVERIMAAVSNPSGWRPEGSTLNRLLSEVSEERLIDRWRVVLEEIEALQIRRAIGLEAGQGIISPSFRKLRWSQRVNSLRAKVVDRLPGWLLLR